MKKDMLKIKDSLEQRVKNHKELVRKARSIEQDIEVLRMTKVNILYDIWHIVDGTKETGQSKKSTESIIGR